MSPLASNDRLRTASPAGPKENDKTNRRTACNQCRQQKLRCDLTATANDTPDAACSRCQRLHLECRVDTDFKRVRKRRRSFELESEIRSLRQQLRTEAPAPSPALEWSLDSTEAGLLSPTATYNSQMMIPADVTLDSHRIVTETLPAPTDSSSTAATGPSPDPAEHSRAPGLTTRPGVDEPSEPHRRSEIGLVPCPRALNNIALSVEEIEELFTIYMTNYHPFLPVLDSLKSPHDLYSSSELLFWSIISVASRRFQSQPTLLPRLARAVTDLVWRSIRAAPYSLGTVQALTLLCTWPFPTSSSTADQTFVLTGIMLQLAVQMGLHRAFDVQDFVKVPVRLTVEEHENWVRTWNACNVVAQSVSTGCGLPIMIQLHDWSLTTADSLSPGTLNTSLHPHLRIEQFRHRVSQALGSNSVSSSASERLSLYRLLNTSLTELESEIRGFSAIIPWYLASARLHLHAFYLLDDVTTQDYNSRILQLYQTACVIIQLSQDIIITNSGSTFFAYCPFFCYQAFVCAAFVILKILTNGFFRPLIDANAARKVLDSAIVSLRAISVVNNDLPARLGDVIAFFRTLSNENSLGGATAADLKLREVKNRLSMSVVYDSLWIWRKHFRSEDDPATRAQQTAEDKFSPLSFSTNNGIDGR